MIDQLTHVLNELIRLYGDADRLLDQYVGHVRDRDGLNLPLPAIRLTHIDTRAGLSLDVRRALELAVSDLSGEKAPPANDGPSVPTLFQLETGVTADLTPRQAAQQLKGRRHG